MSREWKLRNVDKVGKHQKTYYERNKERLKMKSREWKRNNPVKRAKQRLCEKERYHDRRNPY